MFGKIYKIICNITGLIYIGSTTKDDLQTRLKEHEARYKKNTGGYYTCYKIFDNGNYKIELIEDVDCNSKKELRNRERYWIENTDCVNIVIPGRTRKERDNLLVNKVKKAGTDKVYYDKNKEKIALLQKEYRGKSNCDKIKYNWFTSMFGSPYKNNMSLLKIDPFLFN